MLSVKVPGNYWNNLLPPKGGKTTTTTTNKTHECFFRLTLKPPLTESIGSNSKLRTTNKSLTSDGGGTTTTTASSAAFDEQFQFAWSTTPSSVNDASLTISFHEIRAMNLKNVLSGGAADHTLGSTTLNLASRDDFRSGDDNPGPCENLIPNRWSEHSIPIGDVGGGVGGGDGHH